MARHDGLRGPDDGRHRPHLDAHLGPPPEPHRNEQVRIAFSPSLFGFEGLVLTFLCSCSTPRTDTMLEVMIAYAISTGEQFVLRLPPLPFPVIASAFPSSEAARGARRYDIEFEADAHIFPGALNW